MTYKDIVSTSGIPTEYFGQQLFYEWIVKDFLKDGMNIIEIGLFAGRSTAHLASKIKEAGLKINYKAVDHFKGSAEHQISIGGEFEKDQNWLYNLCVENMKKCEVDQYVEIIQEESTEYSKKFPDEYFDFIFVDASHDYSSVIKDIDAWFPKLKRGGIIGGDDYHPTWDGVIRAVNEKFKDKKLYSEPNMHERWLPPAIWYYQK